MMFFPIEKLAKLLVEIGAALHRRAIDIPEWKMHQGDLPGAEQPSFDDSAWTDFHIGDAWGGYDVTCWFRARVPVPPELRDQNLALFFLVGPRDDGDSTAETMLYVNGTPLQGIDIWHPQAWLPSESLTSGELAIALKAWSGVLGVPERRRFKLAQLVWVDPPTEQFFYLATTLLKTVKVLPEGDLGRLRLLQALDASFLQVDFTSARSDSFYASLPPALASLKAAAQELSSLHELKPRVVGIGHAHLDLAWLWRLAHTREKAARTFATALHLMRRYPEYHFLHSSPQLYAWLKQDYPDLWSRVKEQVACGRWEITGGMWVEADTNIPSGESLIRQILFGRRYVRAEFGVETRLLWLPDVFGYSWALPQIARKSGLEYFMTTKISWSQFNRFPHDTFRWRGIDGTELLTHFITTPEDRGEHYTYIGMLEPFDVKGLWDSYRGKEFNDELLLAFGWGDGGGGPTREMLESARALRNLPGLPAVTLGKAEPFFERLAARVSNGALPIWDGELYLEYHRGTYTSQAANKRANRAAEVLYHDAEWLASLASILTGAPYPLKSLDAGWEIILLNQFHDILPGSSIHGVYEDSALDYARVRALGQSALEAASASLVPRLSGSLLVLNSLSWDRDELIELPLPPGGPALVNELGDPLPSQVVEGEGEQSLLIQVRAPALGYRVFQSAAPALPTSSPRLPAGAPGESSGGLLVTSTHLENPFYKIALNDRGQLTSLFDKRMDREVLAPGAPANVFQAFQDKPLNFDAWDIDIFYPEKMWELDHLVDARVLEQGPLRGVLQLAWHWLDSTLTQRLTLYRDSPRIDFVTTVDWHARQVLLKVAFPVAIRSPRATCEIQFGNIERPTHGNTSWDWARFEWPIQRWVDLSEGEYGVALLNDCKYGCDVRDNVLRLTLLKSPIRPDPQADQGLHQFTYSLLPHAGDWRAGCVVQSAYALNNPLRAQSLAPASAAPSLPAQYSLLSVECDHLIVETVKKAQDEEAWIIRLYEYKGARGPAALRFAHPLRRAVECNLVEEGGEPASFKDTRLSLSITPYEIKTFKIWFALPD